MRRTDFASPFHCVAPRTIGSGSTENSENSVKAHILMLRVYVLHSLTQENPGNEYIFDSVQDTRANMQTHLEIATNLVHEYGLVAYADELIELQTLVTTTTETISHFYATEVVFSAGPGFDMAAINATLEECLETTDAPDASSDTGDVHS